MTRPARLHDLSHAQIGALLLAARGPLRWSGRGWRVADVDASIDRNTFRAMVRLGLFRMRETNDGYSRTRRTTAGLTLHGYTLADLAITLSREIALAVQGLPDRLPIEARTPDGPAIARAERFEEEDA